MREKEILVRDAFIQARSATDGLTPSDDGFKKIKKKFEKLPDDIDDINNKIQVITYKILLTYNISFSKNDFFIFLEINITLLIFYFFIAIFTTSFKSSSSSIIQIII